MPSQDGTCEEKLKTKMRDSKCRAQFISNHPEERDPGMNANGWHSVHEFGLGKCDLYAGNKLTELVLE